MRRPIAIFDSGVGGLTVMREVVTLLPHEEIVYLGDTARVPYGIKGKRTITRFARQNVRFLLTFEPKLIVVACNTASAVALPELAREFEIPILGVVGPSGRAAAESTKTGRVAVLGTEATMDSGAYREAIRARNPDIEVYQKACPLLVPMVEEGRGESSSVVSMVLAEYIEPVKAFAPDVVVLGCTHYPLLAGEVTGQLGEGIRVVDSARATALAVAQELKALRQMRTEPGDGHRFLVTDNPERFEQIGGHFWTGHVQGVELVDAESFFETAGELA